MGTGRGKREDVSEAILSSGRLIPEKEIPTTLTMLVQLDIFEQRFDEARKHLDRAEQENEKLINPAVFMIVQDLRSKLPPT